jgi:hypothetical protein
MDVQRDGKKRGEILNEDRREIGWMKEIGKRRESIKRRGVGDRNYKGNFVCNFLELLFYLYLYFGIRKPVGKIKHL